MGHLFGLGKLEGIGGALNLSLGALIPRRRSRDPGLVRTRGTLLIGGKPTGQQRLVPSHAGGDAGDGLAVLDAGKDVILGETIEVGLHLHPS